MRVSCVFQPRANVSVCCPLRVGAFDHLTLSATGRFATRITERRTTESRGSSRIVFCRGACKPPP
jgi:hypothetical protein